MNTFIKKTLAAVALVAGALTVSSAPQTLFITEVYPSGSGGSYAADWFELTNTGSSALDITGWTVDDSSNSFAASLLLRGVTSIAAGQSVVFAEANTAGTNDATIITNFKAAWFGGTVPGDFVMGTYGGAGIGLSGSGDAVSIFDASGILMASITFGTTTAGATLDNAAGLNGTTVSTLSVAGVNGAFTSFNGAEIGSPGAVSAVPEPSTYAALLGTSVLGFVLCRRNRGSKTV